MGPSTKRLTTSGHSSQNSFSALLNTGWSTQFSGAPAVCEAVKLVTSGCSFQKHLDNGLQIWELVQTLSGKNVIQPSMTSGCHFNIMAKFIVNNRTDAWKTDVKLFFHDNKLSNCSLSLVAASHKLYLGYWPSLRSRWLDIGQVLFLHVYGPRRSNKDGSILPARVANHSAWFASSCTLTELAIY